MKTVTEGDICEKHTPGMAYHTTVQATKISIWLFQMHTRKTCNSKGWETSFWLGYKGVSCFPFFNNLVIIKEAKKIHLENWYLHINNEKRQVQKQKGILCTSKSYHQVNHHVVLWLSSFVKCLKCCLIFFAICLVLWGWLCVCSWDATLKPCHILGLEEKGGCQELKRDD